MKQILLRITAILAEMSFRKCAELLRLYFFLPMEIFLPQNALDPDVNRESAQALIGKEHHAISDLRPDTWQRAELFSKIRIGKRRPCFEIGCA